MPNLLPKTSVVALSEVSCRLLERAGLRLEVAADISDILLEGDVLGHRTHGFAFLPLYLTWLEQKTIATDGDVRVVSDSAAAFAWDAHRLPGAWVVRRALREMIARSKLNPVVTGTIANCSHIGCLQAYLKTATDNGLFITLSATNPGMASVAPFGGVEPILTTNPIAYGIPTDGDPILIDQCTSVVSNAAVRVRAETGKPLPPGWLLGPDGEETSDPTQMSADPPATIMPLGGTAFGYKGFGFGIMVEALTLGLSGFGRTSSPDRFGQSVFMQVIDPAGFFGRSFFQQEMSELARRCRESRPKPNGPSVRLPGERALAERTENLNDGMHYPSEIIEKIHAWCDRLGVIAHGIARPDKANS